MAKRVKVNGRVSWFGGPNDGMDSGRTAGGQTTAVPGVAIRPGGHYESGRPTLGGYWRITDPKTGKSVVLKQTDIGPNQSTGRRIDVTYSALKKFGYSERNFPTDANWTAEYLGKSPGARTQTRSGPVKQTGAVSGGSDLQAQARRQAAAQWLLSSSKSTADLQNRVAEAEASVPASTPTAAKTPTTVRRQDGGSTPLASAAKQRADQIDSKKLPYKWGGGHGGKVDPATATPLDCSGAVSAVIGINPRVSGQFQSWGRPGRAPGGKGVTIYSNAEHVLMEIDGRFWGTSKSNPGGGAGWIPRSQVSASYLSRFTARHSRR